MPTRTPIPVSRAMRQISANLDLARRQQRIPVALLAERAGLSMPTVTKMLRTGNGSFENFLRIARPICALQTQYPSVQRCPSPPGTFPAEHNAMHRIFQDCMPDRWGRNLMLRAEHQDARSEHRTARTLFEGDLLLSVNDETRQGALRFWNNDGDALAPSETGGPREVTIQSRIHSNDEQLL